MTAATRRRSSSIQRCMLFVSILSQDYAKIAEASIGKFAVWWHGGVARQYSRCATVASLSPCHLAAYIAPYPLSCRHLGGAVSIHVTLTTHLSTLYYTTHTTHLQSLPLDL